MTETAAQLSATELVSDYEQYKKSRLGSRSIANANWVTTLAHPCEAYAVYMRTVPPDKRIPLAGNLGMIFSEGDDQARAIKRDLLDMGWDVEGAEGQMSWPAYQITGRQDLKIRKPGVRAGVFAEIKSCAPYTYDSINSIADLRDHKWTFIQKWYRQVVLYMVLKSVDRYWMILKNKSTGTIKIIEFALNEDELREAEEMLRKAERVNKLIQIGEPPPIESKISTSDLCPECEMFNVCLPDLDFGVGAQILSGEKAAELEKALDRRQELEKAAKEYNAIDDDVKDEVKAMAAGTATQLVAGNWIISLKYGQRAAEKVPRPAYDTTTIKFTKPTPKE